MKNKLLLLGALIFILSSCNEESYVPGDAGKMKADQTDRIRWYGTSVADIPTTKGVADQSKLWNASAPIDVKFLNSPSDPAIIEKIQNYAKEWEEYAGITFNFVPNNEKAVVRIAFDWNGNDLLTWSYTGNQARIVLNQNQPTAVFGGLQYLSEEELKGDVLRVFGQILGLEYEQRHLGWNDSWWKKDQNGNYYAQSYWETMFEGYSFDWDLIRQFVFDPMSERNAVQTAAIDLESIMLWPYYTRIEVQDRAKLIANYELSENDKLFIAKLYPLEDRPILVMTTEPVRLSFSVDVNAGKSGELFVDWGNGKKISYQTNSNSLDIYPPEEWQQSGEERIVRVYGNAKDVKSLLISAIQKDGNESKLCRTQNIDFSKLTEIYQIGISNLQIEKLNIANLAKLNNVTGQCWINNLTISNCGLEYIHLFTYNYIMKIDISKCPNLFSFSNPLLTSRNIDNPVMQESNHVFTDCPLLGYIGVEQGDEIQNMNVITNTKLVIDGCPQLVWLRYQNCGLVDISISSGCENLRDIFLDRNKLTSIDISNLKQLNYLVIDDNPLENNKEELEKLAAQLPYSETGSSLSVSQENEPQIKSWIGEIISEKNWKINE